MIRRLIRAAGAVAVVLLTLTGLPVALVAFQRAVDWQWPLIAAQPLSAEGVAAAGLGCGWLLWLLLVRLLILDVLDAVRHVARAPRLPVPLHTAVTAAAGGLLLAVNALRGGTETVHPPAGAPVADAATWHPPADRPATGRTDRAAPTVVNAGQAPTTTVRTATAGAPADAEFAVDGPDVGGVTVPGGWLPLPVLAAIGTAAAALWAQRRRSYRPGRPAGARRADGDLTAMPAALRRLLRYDRAVDILEHRPGSFAEPDERAERTAAPAARVPADEHTGTGLEDEGTTGALRPAAVWAMVPPPGVSLLGPGAHDAARGLLVTLCTDTRRDAVPVSVTVDVLDLLLGPGCTATGSPRLHVIGHQLPPAAATWPTTPAGPSAGHSTRLPANLPTSLAIGTTADSTGRATDQGVLLTGADTTVADGVAASGMLVVRVGTWPGAPTWLVAGDGTVHSTGTTSVARRVAVLDQETTRAVLTGLGLLTVMTPPATPTGPPPESGGPAGGGTVTPAAPPLTTGTSTDTGRSDGTVLGSWPAPPSDAGHHPRRLQIQLLGQPVVLRPHPDGSRTTVTIRRSAARQILLLLAVHRAPVTTDTIKETVWPDVPSSAAHRLYLTNMSELRRALADAAGQPVLCKATNTARPGLTRHWFDPDTIDVDVWRLHDLLDAADSTVEQLRRVQLLRQAADLCRGDLADGHPEEWLTVERERLARHALDLHVHLADLEPDHDTAVRLLRRACRDAPGNEAIHRRLLQRHAAADDTDGLQRAAATLAEHLTAAGATPEPDTVTLLTSLLHDLPDGLNLPAHSAPAATTAAAAGIGRTVKRSRP